jgi:superfamily II DNA or RNA helicase
MALHEMNRPYHVLRNEAELVLDTQRLQFPSGLNQEIFLQSWPGILLDERNTKLRDQYRTIAEDLFHLRVKMASLLREMAKEPSSFGVEMKWRTTQRECLLACANHYDAGYQHLGYEIPTGVGKSMIIGAVLRAYFEACKEVGLLENVEAILLTSRSNLVTQLMGNSAIDFQNRMDSQGGFDDHSNNDWQDEDSDNVLLGDEPLHPMSFPRTEDDLDDDVLDFGDVQKWVSPILSAGEIRSVTGETERSERRKDAALTVMTYQGFSVIRERLRQNSRKVGMLFFDEAHRISVALRQKILEQFPSALRVGGSATMKGPPTSRPFEIFESIENPTELEQRPFHRRLAYHASLPQAIERNELKPVRYIQKGAEIDLSDISMTSAGNFNQEELTRKMMYSIPVLVQFIREVFDARYPVLDLSGTKSVAERTFIVSVKRVELAQKLADICNKTLGLNADWTSGHDRGDVFREKIGRLAQRKLQLLFSAGKLGEGLDVSQVNGILSLWPYNRSSAWVLKQLIGRGTRLHDGDNDCLVIEPTYEHGAHKIATALDFFDVEETPQGLLLSGEQERAVEGKIVGLMNKQIRLGAIWDKYWQAPRT